MIRPLTLAVPALLSLAIAGAAPPASDPISLAILIDVTSSMHTCPGGVAGLPSTTPAGSGQVMTEMSLLDRRPIPPAVEEFPLLGIEGGDRVRLGAIGRRFELSAPLAGGSSQLRKAWSQLFAKPPIEWMGPSPIWDFVAEAAQVMAAETGRRAIILLTDGQAAGNRLGRVEAAAAARAGAIPVSVVAAQSMFPAPVSGSGTFHRNPLIALSDFAAATGGSFVLDRAVTGAAHELCFKRDPSNALWEVIKRTR